MAEKNSGWRIFSEKDQLIPYKIHSQIKESIEVLLISTLVNAVVKTPRKGR